MNRGNSLLITSLKCVLFYSTYHTSTPLLHSHSQLSLLKNASQLRTFMRRFFIRGLFCRFKGNEHFWDSSPDLPSTHSFCVWDWAHFKKEWLVRRYAKQRTSSRSHWYLETESYSHHCTPSLAWWSSSPKVWIKVTTALHTVARLVWRLKMWNEDLRRSSYSSAHQKCRFSELDE